MKTIALLFVLCMAPLAGFSATLTTSSEYGLPISLTLTEINQTGTLSKFDSNLGTLTGATLIIYTGAEFTMSMTNNSSQDQTGKITSSTELFFTSSETEVNTLIQAQNVTLSAASPVTTITVGQTVNFPTYSKDADSTYDLSAVLSSVQSPGGGNFTINTQSLSGFSIGGGGGNISSTQNTNAGAGARIIYSYTAVPEPTITLLCGIAGFTLLIRRRR